MWTEPPSFINEFRGKELKIIDIFKFQVKRRNP
jgi:hypothetical protein